MKDEEYVLRQDNRDRAVTARSARNKRTHCGRGGRVKLPSDYMTKKEIKAMSGEVKSYRLNEPMNWEAWKQLPDDLKADYIKAIREKYGVSDKTISTAMGVNNRTFSLFAKDYGFAYGKRGGHRTERDKEGFLAWWYGVQLKSQEPVDEVAEEPIEAENPVFEPMKWEQFKEMPDEAKVSYINQIRQRFNASDSQIAIMLEKNRRDFATEIKRLGLGLGRDRIGGMTRWDKEGFYAWMGKDAPSETVEEPVNEVETVEEVVEEVKQTPNAHVCMIPTTGQLTFEGNVDEICNTLKTLLNGASVRMFLKWNLMEVQNG